MPMKLCDDGLIKHLVHERFLHWDVSYECDEEYHWSWNAVPKKYPSKRGDFIFIALHSNHQHFATGPTETRIIVISNRIIKKMGMD
jgi:hypothetical protein